MRSIFIALLTPFVLLSACDESPGSRDIGDPNRPIELSAEQNAANAQQFAELTGGAGAPAALDVNRAYDLPSLIDLAQSRNPATREAWIAAKEAGQQAGVTSSALLPFVTAAALAGKADLNQTLEVLPVLGGEPFSPDNDGTAVAISATWLLYDFGENAARQRVADNLAQVAEQLFNAVHRQLIFDVTVAYHARLAALKKLDAAQRARERSAELVDAAEQRQRQGVGTTIEVAQAKQLDAQTLLLATEISGEARASAVALAALVSAPSNTGIKLRAPRRGLPSATDAELEQVLEQAFLKRTDVRIALAQVNAAQAELDATVASYRPKVFGGGFASTGSGSITTNGLAPLDFNTTGARGVFVGVSVPIFDGGLRERRLALAQDRLDRSRAGVEVAKLTATIEIANAYETLRTALALYPAANALTDASRVTAEAAKDAYLGGLIAIAEAGAAALALYASEEALADAERDARQAAASLALATGN